MAASASIGAGVAILILSALLFVAGQRRHRYPPGTMRSILRANMGSSYAGFVLGVALLAWGLAKEFR